MLRIHFTPEDIGRVRIDSAPDAMWEIILSSHLLQTRRGRAPYNVWYATVRERMTENRSVRNICSAVCSLAPHAGYTPDFLTPWRETEEISGQISSVVETPPQRIHSELRRLDALTGTPRWVWSLATGGRTARREFGAMLGTYHRYVIAPYELQIRSEIDADRLRRTRALLDGGIDGLLHSFRPLMRWEPPILHVTYPFSRDLHLRGRGLRLIPAYFCTRHSITLADPELPPVLAYPLHNGTVRFPASERDAGALAQLLGATRARALEAIASGCTTTELGRVLGVSSAAASQHARTLREAGLVSSNRERQHVLHSITPLGTALLDRQDLPRAC